MRNLSLFLLIASSLLFQNCTAEKSKADEATATAPKEIPGTPVFIDADTGNEIDDLYAIVRALSAPELDIRAISSAQYHTSPIAPENSVGDSQRLNEEIVALMRKEGVPLPLGSNEPLTSPDQPHDSPAARKLIEEAHKMSDGEKLEVVILGSTTNVASAILIDPTIIPKITVSYIGFWHNRKKNTFSKKEFNTNNDPIATDLLLNTNGLDFDVMTATTSGALKFQKSVADEQLGNKGGIHQYLLDRWNSHPKWWEKDQEKKDDWIMWDVAIIEALIHREWAAKEEVPNPEANVEGTFEAYISIEVEKMTDDFWQALNSIKN